tara:strand:- start:589 stop:717 length:129 start_codon:yes stop_codon:yes gene_type:complete
MNTTFVLDDIMDSGGLREFDHEVFVENAKVSRAASESELVAS